MQDRIPTPGQEGRVLITPENGGAPFYAKVAMADNPTQNGTPYNKQTVLQDSTAALFDLDSAALPNDVFSILSKAAVWDGNFLKTILGDELHLIIANSGAYYGNNGTSVTIATGAPAKLAFIYGIGQSTDNFFILVNGISQIIGLIGGSSGNSGHPVTDVGSVSFSDTSIRLSSLGDYRYYINQSGRTYTWVAFS